MGTPSQIPAFLPLTFTLGSDTQNVAQCPLHHVIYAPAKFEVAASNGLRDAFTRTYTTQNITRYPLYHMTYAPARFEAATSNSLGGDAFTRKNII